MDRQLYFLLFAFFVILFSIIIHHYTVYSEGFDNATTANTVGVPNSTQGSNIIKPEARSVIANSMPGSVSASPINSLASSKDILSLVDTIKNFNDLYEKFVITCYPNTDYTALHRDAIKYLMKLQEQIDSGKVVDDLNFITDEKTKYLNAIKSIQNNSLNYKNINSLTEVQDVFGIATLDDLTDAITRAYEEQRRIENLRSESPELKERILILEKIQSDFKNIKDKVTQNLIPSSEIPVTKNDIAKFLKDIQNPSSNLTPLPILTGAESVNNALLYASSTQDTVPDNSVQTLIDKLRESMRDISWDMKIEIGYDPNVRIQRELLERVKSISVLIESGNINDRELKVKTAELEMLKQYLKSYSARNMNGPEPVDKSEYSYMKPGGLDAGLMNKYDYKIRPGYEMTDKMIKNRGSNASFDTSSLGELDYKKTVQFLCSQIKLAGLGEPKEFGCIENPEAEVGPKYSWKGNYKMVCSRLGNTWGEFYPEMFGCPKPDMAHKQYPKNNKN